MVPSLAGHRPTFGIVRTFRSVRRAGGNYVIISFMKKPDHAGTERYLRHQLTRAIALLQRHGVAKKKVQPLLDGLQWIVIATGGNTKPGNTGNFGSCPCQSEYTVATVQTPLNAWPNPAALNNCAQNLPPPQPAEIPCQKDCVQVMTHIWHGWMVVQNAKTGALILNCDTFAQYHCKKPNDPDRNRPPRHTDPNDPNPDL